MCTCTTPAIIKIYYYRDRHQAADGMRELYGEDDSLLGGCPADFLARPQITAQHREPARAPACKVLVVLKY